MCWWDGVSVRWIAEGVVLLFGFVTVVVMIVIVVMVRWTFGGVEESLLLDGDRGGRCCRQERGGAGRSQVGRGTWNGLTPEMWVQMRVSRCRIRR